MNAAYRLKSPAALHPDSSQCEVYQTDLNDCDRNCTSRPIGYCAVNALKKKIPVPRRFYSRLDRQKEIEICILDLIRSARITGSAGGRVCEVSMEVN